VSVWFRRAVLECARYTGEKVGAAVEECFCALCDEDRSISGWVFEDGREDSSLWLGTAWLYSLGFHLGISGLWWAGLERGCSGCTKKAAYPWNCCIKFHNYPADVRGTSERHKPWPPFREIFDS
jgi:hypothetical protein